MNLLDVMKHLSSELPYHQHCCLVKPYCIGCIENCSACWYEYGKSSYSSFATFVHWKLFQEEEKDKDANVKVVK